MSSPSFFLILFLSTMQVFAHDHIPEHEASATNTNIGLRVFKPINNFTLKLEYQTGNKYEEQRYSFFKLGSSYKLARGLKLFTYYSGHRGLRHPDDWIVTPNGEWKWFDTGDRLEHLVDVGFRYKFRPNELAPYLMGVDSFFQFNDFNGQSIFIFEPSFQYFTLNKGEPIWSYKAKLSLYHALNFVSEDIYKKGLYLSVNRHVQNNLVLSLSYRYLLESWSESETFLDTQSESYIAEDITHSLNLNISLFI
jgi:hypothetical protein